MERHGCFAFLSFVMSTELLGCNDNNNDSRVPPVSSTTTLKGVVLGVGMIQGATVCLDKNDSLTCERLVIAKANIPCQIFLRVS